jgi:hypothetical protein
MEEKRIGFWKFLLVFLFLIALAFGIIFAIQIYKQNDINNKLDEMEKKNKEDQDRALQLIMADTYGGKTPQETLQMYITAVEKGDYALASKYFIAKYQDQEKDKLMKADKKGIDFLLNYLKQSSNSFGYFSSSTKRFSIERPIFIDFMLYPNGVWKLVEI